MGVVSWTSGGGEGRGFKGGGEMAGEGRSLKRGEEGRCLVVGVGRGLPGGEREEGDETIALLPLLSSHC